MINFLWISHLTFHQHSISCDASYTKSAADSEKSTKKNINEVATVSARQIKTGTHLDT